MTLLSQVFLVALGGAVGAVARYGVYLVSGHLLGTDFPFATLIVNVLGSFVLGLLIETMALAWSAPEAVRLLVVVGGLGAFTTFSTFSLDFAVLTERGRPALAVGYALISVTLSVGALFAGLAVIRFILTGRL